ncbi:hypothetical protein DFH06DRAFT_1350066 [Mycena polygramma]|nr:hypothetical protein DFH06DRAFT_1350066 [Mycena polygramma]
MPHPEAHMNDVLPTPSAQRPWGYFIIDSLDMMTAKLTRPYIVYYPTASCDGMLFPVNKTVQDIQGANLRDPDRQAWRGDILVGKINNRECPFSSMLDASMADYPIIKNYMMTHISPY